MQTQLQKNTKQQKNTEYFTDFLHTSSSHIQICMSLHSEILNYLSTFSAIINNSFQFFSLGSRFCIEKKHPQTGSFHYWTIWYYKGVE